MPLKLYFRFRSGIKRDAGEKQLLIRLFVNGEREPVDYASGVFLRPDLWNQSKQQCEGRTKLAQDINASLERIKLEHKDILDDMDRRHKRGESPRPTVGRVRMAWMDPNSEDPALLDFFDTYTAYEESLIGSEDGKAGKTMDRLRTGRKHLAAFLEYYLPKSGITGRYVVRDVSTAMGKQFHAWLQVMPVTGKRRMGKDSATKYLGVLRDCLEYAIDSDLLNKNPLDKFRPKRGRLKEIYFLDDGHVQALMKLTHEDKMYSTVLWWTRMMCYTALDFEDAVRYARNRKEFERETEEGVIIHIRRSKLPRNWCEIPLHPIVEFLFMLWPEGPHNPGLPKINLFLKSIQADIGFHGRDSDGKPWVLTSKICRKTAGAVFMRMGYSIEFVSKLMAHSSIRTTIQHYASVKALSMQTEMARVKKLNY